LEQYVTLTTFCLLILFLLREIGKRQPFLDFSGGTRRQPNPQNTGVPLEQDLGVISLDN
jgi:hypothetical protein